MRKYLQKAVAGTLAAALVATSFGSNLTGAFVSQAAAASAIDSQEFANPSKAYQPGVRWWWPGGAVEEEELIKEIDYLAERNIGYVEINPFNISQVEEADTDKVASIYTEEFYALLDTAITRAEEKGITVDLNMGSGWNANSEDVELADSMGNMALGRTTVAGDDLSVAEQTSHSITGINIPQAEKSNFYYGDAQKGNWDDSLVKLQGVLVAELTGNEGLTFVPGQSWSGPTPAYNEFQNADGETITYKCQLELNVENSVFIDAADSRINGETLTLNEGDLSVDTSKDYEVIALYSLPSGGTGIDCATGWYVVDHMNGEKTAEYINNWLGKDAITAILEKHDNIRAVFNDSYEFYSDVYYTEDLYDLSKDTENNGLGYDFSKYLPTVYKEYSAAPFYMGLGTKDTFLTYTLDSGEKTRIMYDYNTLVGSKFAEGMEGFQSAANAKGLLYRQEAYNPPIDTLASAKYVDIPEGEQGNEMSLIRVSSGAHLYNKNLVTCEQYTLGCTPFKNTLEQVKIGYDNMATSGVNNFFYHGMNYQYGVGTDNYGENGWSPMSGIGINVSEANTLSSYLDEMNLYAARVNYLMQQGSASKDVALYMPYNGSLSETDAVKTMNSTGIAWDAINDDSIQADNTAYTNGVISVNGGNMEYQAILVEISTVPTETMEKLKTLAAAGANIIFYGTAPSSQPGYADGNYEKADENVAAIAAEMCKMSSVSNPQDTENLASVLKAQVTPFVTYADNENVRFVRRTLTDGGELVYIRNIGETENTITVKANGNYENYYWLDQNTGKIYKAQEENGMLTFTLGASTDSYSGKHSMAIALLCEPAGVTLDASSLSAGAPASITKEVTDETVTLTMESLSVTADNLDGTIGGEETTVVYTDNVLGKWNDASFHEGALQTVTADGTYKTSYTLEKGETAKKAILKLNNVYTAATISVNGKEAGKLMYAPYELDITSLLKEGKNEISIVVTPRKMNRYYNATNGQYSSQELIDTGMEGPVTLGITTEKEAQQPDTDTPQTETDGKDQNQNQELNIADAKISYSTKKVYTGKAIKPGVTVTLGSKKLKAGTDYNIYYKNNKKTGKATITIKGKGNYTGVRTLNFNIVPKRATLSKAAKYKTKALKVIWKRDKTASGYQIQVCTKKNFKSGVKSYVIKSNKTTSKVIKKLKSKKTYYVRVRSYKTIDGSRKYGAFSWLKKVKVK